MRHTRIDSLILLVGLALLPASLQAQYPKVAKQPPGGLAGEVVNDKGAPVAAAVIMWQPADGEKPHVLHSDAHGHFRIAPLRAGLYDLRASAGAASSDWAHNLLVNPGTDTNVTLRLVLTAPPKKPSH
jgi:hypothetical protein